MRILNNTEWGGGGGGAELQDTIKTRTITRSILRHTGIMVPKEVELKDTIKITTTIRRSMKTHWD